MLESHVGTTRARGRQGDPQGVKAMTTTKRRPQRTKQPHGCRCQCGTPTYRVYAPGHDAKHVTKMVAMIITSWGTGQTTTRWKDALAQLGTPSLGAKFRVAMRRLVVRQFTDSGEIDRMWNESWQRQMNLRGLLAESDPEWFHHSVPLDAHSLAIYAVAMGWTKDSVQNRRS